MRTTLFLVLLLAVASTGCARLLSVYDDSYQCPVAQSGNRPCEPASAAYLRALSKPGLPPPPDLLRYQSPTPTEGDAWQAPVRTVWLAPYVDSSGRRHEATLMRIVVMPGPPIVRPEPEFLVPPVPTIGDDVMQMGPPVPPAETTSPSGGNRGGGLGNQGTFGNQNPRGRSPLGQGGGFSIPGLPPSPQSGLPNSNSGGFAVPGY